MIFSKHNIFAPVSDSENYFIVNLLSGNADIIDNAKALELQNEIFNDREELIDKGYLVDETEEKNLFEQKYKEFISEREADEVQIFFVPTYSCNFACTYCYQDEYDVQGTDFSSELTDAFFNYLDSNFSSKKKYITIFGGEPLINTVSWKTKLKYFLSECKKRSLDIALVTNGYFLEEYIDILKTASVREIQVTLDGTADIHNNRRFLKNRQPTFSKIVSGIDRALVAGFTINLRVVVDKENIKNLPEIARFAIDKGWTKLNTFKTQLGRNYELHHCQQANVRLFDRLSLYQELYKIVVEHPYFVEFHKPSFSISRFLFENEELPNPLFDSCPACKTEWAFDFTGSIYSCTATVGKKGEELGTFFPEVSQQKEAICQWQKRDITTIKECSDCSVQLACGGGCGSIAKNKTGSINTPDCRPVKELLQLGFAYYSKD